MSVQAASTAEAPVARGRYRRTLIPICLVFGIVGLVGSSIVAVPAIATEFQLWPR